MPGPNIVAVRLASLALLGVFVEQRQSYLSGWTDEAVAARIGIPAAEVARVREAAFGSQANATIAWRQRQAVLLVERWFDYTEGLGARDLLAAEVGEDALYQLQLAGQAPAGGVYAPGWHDDAIADLTGLAPGDVYAIRNSIRWIPEVDRPAARRARDIAGLPPTRAARVMRLAAMGDPSGEEYTLDALGDALLEAGEIDASTAGRREELVQWVATTIEAGRARLDSAGRRRTLVATAKVLGFSREWTYRLLARFDADPEVGKRGKPSPLTPAVVERLQALDARRFDRGSWYGWLAAMLWPGKKRPTTRTLKNWRERGAADIAAGTTTIYREFEEAVIDLMNRAPADAPILPTAAELAEVAELSDRAAAERLGVTSEQLEAARTAGRTA